tara:strand:+ start:66 stop:491 length:426 start_codon:yes stop_codon:yes gene_type:complete
MSIPKLQRCQSHGCDRPSAVHIRARGDFCLEHLDEFIGSGSEPHIQAAAYGYYTFHNVPWVGIPGVEAAFGELHVQIKAASCDRGDAAYRNAVLKAMLPALEHHAKALFPIAEAEVQAGLDADAKEQPPLATDEDYTPETS